MRCETAIISRRAKPGLEIARDVEAHEHSAEGGRLEQDEDEDERGVAALVAEARHLAEPGDPPANARNDISGKSIGGRKSAGFLNSTVICRGEGKRDGRRQAGVMSAPSAS